MLALRRLRAATACSSSVLLRSSFPFVSSSSSASSSLLVLAHRRRPFSSSLSLSNEFPSLTPDRAEDEVDVCIVGAGPAGLSAAIRIKQLEKERGGEEKRVIVLEKGAEVGESNFALVYSHKRGCSMDHL